MKNLGISFFFLLSTLAFGNVENERKNILEPLEAKEISLDEEFYKCSVTSSGTAQMSNGSIVHLTITVTGPCDSRLAGMMREAIFMARAEISKI